MPPTDLKGRKVSQFRCHIDPMMGGRPKNSFDRREFPNAEFELMPFGVYVKITMKQGPRNLPFDYEGIVPFANIQSITLYPAGVNGPQEKTDETEAKHIKADSSQAH